VSMDAVPGDGWINATKLATSRGPIPNSDRFNSCAAPRNRRDIVADQNEQNRQPGQQDQQGQQGIERQQNQQNREQGQGAGGSDRINNDEEERNAESGLDNELDDTGNR